MAEIKSLRRFQATAALKVENSEHRRIVLCSPTGSGKTVMGLWMAKRAMLERSQRVHWMATRTELIQQVTKRLDEIPQLFGRYGIIKAGHKNQNLYLPMQVSSVDTLVSRTVKRKKLEIPAADIVFIDEAHLYTTEHRQAVVDQFPNAKIVMLTATPRGMGDIADEIIEAATVRELMDHGFLVRPKYYAPSEPDLSNMRIRHGEYVAKDVDTVMQPLMGDIVSHWMKFAGGRRTIVFAHSVESSIYLKDRFVAAGVSAEHCDGSADPQTRLDIFSRFRSGETQLLCNVDIATYGFDLPELDCVVMARPTKSVVRYLQMIGRGLRTSPGKQDCLVLDHAGNVHEHGAAEEDRWWTLDERSGISKVEKLDKKNKPERKDPRSLTCPQCSTVFWGSLTCPDCGYYFESKAKEFTVHDGQLVPLKKEKAGHDMLSKLRFFTEMKFYAREKGYKEGWVAHKYKAKFGQFPPRAFDTYPPAPPTMETLRYIKYLNIKQAYGNKKYGT